MKKQCVCGGDIPLTWSLCADCLEIYKGNRMEWPRWLLFHVNDLNREMWWDRAHDDISYNDEFNYVDVRTTVEGQHYTSKDGWGPYSDS